MQTAIALMSVLMVILLPPAIIIKTEKHSSKVPALSKTDYEALKYSIATIGLQDPIVINQAGDILDGHHRYKICQELGIEPKIRVKDDLLTDLDEEIFVREINCARRHFAPAQKAEQALALRELYREQARANMLAGKTLSRDKERVHSDAKAAKASGISTSTLYKMDQIMQSAKEEPNRGMSIVFEGAIHPDNNNNRYANRYATYSGIAQGVIDGKITIEKGYSMISRDKKTRVKQANQAIQASKLELPKRVTLLNSDSMHMELAEIPDSSVDLIITDPPYLKQFVYIYDELAQFALRKLKPGGNLIFYYGKYHEPEMHKIMSKYEQDLRFHWNYTVLHQGAQNARMHDRHVWVEGKPMINFVKAGATRIQVFDTHDVIYSKKADKDIHPWAQSPVEAEYFITHLTYQDSLVVDPFMGSGAFGIAAAKLGRYFVGIEIVKEKYDLACNNVLVSLDPAKGITS